MIFSVQPFKIIDAFAFEVNRFTRMGFKL